MKFRNITGEGCKGVKKLLFCISGVDHDVQWGLLCKNSAQRLPLLCGRALPRSKISPLREIYLFL